MATKDFRANQIETSKIIGTGSISGTTVGIAIYSGSISSNREGGISDSAMFDNVGSDVFLFVSGTISNSDFNRTDATLFGGDVVISGTLYAERQVIEVDSVADGDFYVTGNMYVEPDSNSDSSVVFSQADGTRVLKVNTSSPNVDINGNLIVTGNIHMQSDNLDGINIEAENNFQIGAQGNIILTIDSDNDDAPGSRFFGIRDGGGAYGLAMYDRGDIIFNNSYLSTQDFQVRADNDASAIYVDASEDAVAIGRFLNTDFGSESGVGTDVKILLSGTVGSKDGADRGVVLTPGDLVVSGTLYPGGNSSLYIQGYNDGTTMIIESNDNLYLRVDDVMQVNLGVSNVPLKVNTNGVIINDSSTISSDFRVESDNLQSAILVDSGDNQIVIGSNNTTAAAENVGTDVVLFVSGTSGENGGKGTSGGATVIGTDLIVSGTYRGGYDALAGYESFQAVSDNYLFLTNLSDFGGSQIEATDSNFFFTGSIGSRGGGTLGTAVFGGDVVTSGSLYVMTGSNQGIILQSPNGTQFYLTVDDSGNLSTSPV